jgi:hypothetical protein
MKPSRIFFLLFISLTSCLTKDQKQTIDAASENLFNIVDTVSFHLDKSTSFRTLFLQATVDSAGNDLLIFLSDRKPSIQFYDVKKQQLVSEIFLEKEGPNGIGSPTGLLYISMDSIFVVSSSHYRVSLINKSGKLLRNYRVLEGTTYNDNTGLIRPFTTSPPFKIGNKIYFNTAPDRDVYKASYFLGKVNLTLDIETGKFEYINNYPQQFENGVWGVAAVNYATDYNPITKDFIYSFAISDSLYTYNTGTLEKEAHLATSKFIGTRIKPMPKPDNEHDLEYALETPYYHAIIYDKYRDVYYRFVRHSISFIDDKSGKPNGFHEKPISIIVLDKDFNRIGETTLVADTFLDYIYFLTKDGLFISNGNFENPDLDEDQMVFTCFQLKHNP